MKTIAILSAALLVFSIEAAAQKELPKNKKPKQSKVDADVWDITVNERLILKYQQPKEVRDEVDKEAKLKLWSEAQRELELGRQPQGGWLKTRLVRSTLSGADPSRLTFVVQDAAGQELQRYQPERDIPSPFSTLGVTVYVGIVIVPLAKPLQTGDKVFVIDDGEQVRFEYEIRPL